MATMLGIRQQVIVNIQSRYTLCMICLLTDNIKYNFWPHLLIATLLFSETKLHYFSLFKHRYIIYSNLYLVIYKFSVHVAIYIMGLTQQFYSRINVQKNYLINHILQIFPKMTWDRKDHVNVDCHSWDKGQKSGWLSNLEIEICMNFK